MTTAVVPYIQGAELPDLPLEWRDAAGALIDFSTGHTFALALAQGGGAPVLNKASGISGASAAPNVRISWDAAELDSLTPGHYLATLTATRTADSKRRKMRFLLAIN